MLPILLDLGILKIYTFGVFITLAFFWASYLVWKLVKLTSYDENTVFDLLFISLFGGIFVGRLSYVVLHFDQFGFSFFKFILINGYPGIYVLGAVVGGIATFALAAYFKKVKLLELIDYIIPALLLVLAIGKLGAFFSGAEVGAPTAFPLSITYPTYDGARHLASLYESIAFFLGSWMSYRLLLGIRRADYPVGAGLVLFAGYYGFVVFLSEFLKERDVIIQNYSLNTWIGGIVSLTVFLYIVYYYRQSIRTRIFSIFQKKT